ncbi:VCBS repeat-containing protein [Flavihumibacter petaseus]|uniref:ASPIC/UnbV domain-containing protein n=1 Tax=Flavihumibacter petaseus NBRC 106054 TaxID=1220578 RepID=A0A0E9N1Y9_9BACT|nr:VCBS repeat-containing protein [Flavihumibacter petaseus]GAO43355.1 hypothetical protein FPE01S_02_04600 [Flavihumibacter petaseus NBRC 106054]
MRIFVALWILLMLAGCKAEPRAAFETLSPGLTGISFVNIPNHSNGLNFLDYLYYYNGGGVAAGDIDNDGLIDLYFTANNGHSNKLYRNKGNFRFEDITDQAGVAGTASWHSGVTMVDVNGDGWLDIYVCAVSGKLGLEGRNQLYINDGTAHFTDQAKAYGLDFEGYSTQAAFFDYDHDGDLDCYLLTQSDHSVERLADTSLRRMPGGKAGDRFFRNDNHVFRDITALAGIYSSVLGYGLGVAVSDIDGDGWDDLYIGNDFHENDYYYHNDGNGHFTEEGSRHFAHYSRFSMGNDIGDFNNDGAPDIITVDMLPEEEAYLKTYSSGESLDIYRLTIERNGYQPQYSRNALQVNLGNGVAFSDASLMAGVSATDWSWSPLFADFDNDGWKDLFISNGIRHRPVDLDYMRYISDNLVQRTMGQTRQLDSAAISRMPDGAVHNYLFRNQGGNTFDNISQVAGLTAAGYSAGAIYADLDNNGTLDLVTNNSFAPAVVYKNNIATGHWLQISLRDTSAANRMGVGAKVWLWQNGKMQYQQLMCTRGFQSSVAPLLHFGIAAPLVDSLRIVWPDQSTQLFTGINAGQHLVLQKGHVPEHFRKKESPLKRFTDVTDSITIPWAHHENSFTDFSVQRLIPHELSDRGPKLAVADINNDGWDDFYVCGAAGKAGALFVSNHSGGWIKKEIDAGYLPATDEVAAIWLDANGDGLPDLYIASGGNEKWTGDSSLADRLYLQAKTGRFTRSNGLPPLLENKSVIATGDPDGDGDTDIFVGVLADAKAYGKPVSSYLLINDGKGHFSKAEESVIPLNDLGMVTGAVWGDLNGDKKPDLVVAGEWMPVTCFINKGNRFEKFSFPHSEGLWQCLQLADPDGDGDLDIIAGNFGTNSKLRASQEYPLKLYVKDFDQNGRTDQLLTYSNAKGEFSFWGKDELETQLPLIKRRFLYYRDYAGKNVKEAFGDWLKDALVLKTETLASAIFRNDGNMNFYSIDLPWEAQLSPVFSFLVDDINADGRTDLIPGGNFYGSSPYEGRYDANWGFILLGRASLRFDAWSPAASGLLNPGETRDIQKLRSSRGSLYLVAQNNSRIRVFQ